VSSLLPCPVQPIGPTCGHRVMSSAAASIRTGEPMPHSVRPNCVLMVKIVPTIEWKITDGRSEALLDPRLLPLLQAIAETGSLAAAVAKCRISYRAAWGVLRVYRQQFSCEFVILERGRGAKLTPTGEKLLQANARAARRLKKMNPALSMEPAAGTADASA
jgi:molybdate transport repressor ModE-like protein